MAYNDGLLEFDGLAKGSLTQEWAAPAFSNRGGVLTIAGAHASDMVGRGNIVKVTFRAKSGVPGAEADLSFEQVQLNDGLIDATLQDDVGAPELTGLDPESGALEGSTAITLSGVNLSAVDEVMFGDLPAKHLTYNAGEGTLTAVTPAVESVQTVSVTASALGQQSVLEDSFEYFDPDVQVDLEPEDEVEVGEPVEVPVESSSPWGNFLRRLSFMFNWNPNTFASGGSGKSTQKVEDLVRAKSGSGIKSVSAEIVRPGQMRVVIEGDGFGDGPLVNLNLVAIGTDLGPDSLIYISDVEAESMQEDRKTVNVGTKAAMPGRQRW